MEANCPDDKQLRPVGAVHRAGDRVVLTGPSGAGKSTLLALLLRFITPTAGTIELAGGGAGGDVAARDVRQWRTQIAWVPQQPYLFTGTAADNIALGRAGATRDAICRAARLAGAADFLEELPAGYDTPLGERGVRLSAGQRQRIALARAFLRDAPLLLLDEPAVHLDPASARLIGTALDTALSDRTVILVSHGQGWAGRVGRVIRLEQGKLMGPPRAPRPGPRRRCRERAARGADGRALASAPPAPAGRAPARPARTLRPDRCGRHRLRRGAAGYIGVHAGPRLVAVRAFSLGRGVSRYLERLTSHDVAFRVLADVRVAIHRRLERLAPAGLAAFRSGDLLAALISDVDATQDLFIRVGPPLAAAVVGAGAVTICLLVLVPAGGVLAVGLVAAGAAVPALAVAASRRAARATAAARGELSATITDLLSGAADPVTEPAPPRPLPDGPVHVQLSGVQVRYEPDGPLVLDGLDLDLPPGRRVALVGPSGAGKSTVAAVLLRFRDPVGGSVTLGGADLPSYAAEAVRTVIGGCPQDPHIFDASIRDNLRLARPGATGDELVAAAARARLLPWIDSLPLGWDIPVRCGAPGGSRTHT